MVWVVSLSPVDLSTRGLTPGKHITVFGVRQDSVTGKGPWSYR